LVYTCPTCKAEFETSFNDGVVQVIWAETTQPEPGSRPMTEADARELLSVSANADFQAIKAAWRKACQQYHPDKHQGLPERLRRAAEVEMKRINEAYRLLERTTASDF
jgi:DnaJ-domain-containing protein 1